MAQDETYQTKTYHERNGKAFVFGSGGAGRIESGGGMRGPVVVIGIPSVSNAGAGLAVFSIVNLPFSYGTVILSGESNLLNPSFWLTSCSVGADIYLILRGDPIGTFTGASTLCDVSTSGCILLASDGGAISGVEMHTSLASDCFVHLRAFADDVWSIVGEGGDINE